LKLKLILFLSSGDRLTLFVCLMALSVAEGT